MGNKPKPIKGKKFQRIVNYFFKFFKMSDTNPTCCSCLRRTPLPIVRQPQAFTGEEVAKEENQQLRKEILQLREKNLQLCQEICQLKNKNFEYLEEIRKLRGGDLKKLENHSARLKTKENYLKLLIILQKEEISLHRKADLLKIEKLQVQIEKTTEEIVEQQWEMSKLQKELKIILNNIDYKAMLEQPPSLSINGNTEQKATTSFSVTTSKEKTTLEEGEKEEAISTFYKELEEAVNDSYNSRYDPDYKPPFSTSEESSFVSGATGDSDSFLQSGPTPDDSTNVKNDPEEKAEQKGPESLLMDEEEHKNPTPFEDDYKTSNEEDGHENKGVERAQYEY